MGTRADFYNGRGTDVEWLGSIAWDGYPEGIPNTIKTAANEKEFRDIVGKFIKDREDGTLPEQGWPWPWEDSRTTDYSYAFDNGKVYVCEFGHKWYTCSDYENKEVNEEDSDKDECVFPDMSKRSNFTLGKRSGVIVIESK